jgi:integrase
MEIACKSAGVPELKFHDLRRTAMRNIRRAGVPQVVSMRIAGHRTDSRKRRYNIVDIEDIKTARQLMERGTTESTSRTVHAGKSGPQSSIVGY